MAGSVGRGLAWLGPVWHGGLGTARRDMAGQGSVGHSRRDLAWQGKSRRGMARQGRQVSARHGSVELGWANHGGFG